jgi:hypothetical protein
MKRISILVITAAAIGIAALARPVVAQTSAGAQPADPSTQPAPSAEQSVPSQQPSTMRSSSRESDPTSSATATSAEPTASSPRARLAAVVPSGMSTEQACSGFKSIRECAAALHAAQNLGIPFPDLKSKLTGGEKLGAAIHDLKPEAKAREQASKAEAQARSDLQGAPRG